MSPNIKNLFSKNFYKCLVALITQQLFVAASIYFLTETTSAFTNSETKRAILCFCLYMATLLLPFIPGSLSLYWLRRWKADVVEKSSLQYVEHYQNKVSIWLNKKLKENLTSHVSSELILVVNRYLDSIYSFLSLSLNLIFSLVALSLVVDAGIALVYSLSIVISFALLKITQKKLAAHETKAQKSRMTLIEVLRRSWDSLVLKNLGNFKMWQDTFLQNLLNYKKSEAHAEGQKQLINIALSFSSLAPTLAYVSWILLKQLSNTSKALATLINVPRLFMLMNNTYAIFTELNELNSSHEIWSSLCKELKPNPNLDPKIFKKITPSKIKVTGPDSENLSYQEFLNLPHLEIKGLYTLQGENGSGKSLSLAKLKESYGDKAYLLPCSHDLFLNATESLSSGQKTKYAIDWISKNKFKNEGVNIFLLDEWDANLDSENTKIVSSKIKDLSKEALVIEVRHSA